MADTDKVLLQERIRAQGDVVRQMKKDKSPKEEARNNEYYVQECLCIVAMVLLDGVAKILLNCVISSMLLTFVTGSLNVPVASFRLLINFSLIDGYCFAEAVTNHFLSDAGQYLVTWSALVGGALRYVIRHMTLCCILCSD